MHTYGTYLQGSKVLKERAEAQKLCGKKNKESIYLEYHFSSNPYTVMRCEDGEHEQRLRSMPSPGDERMSGSGDMFKVNVEIKRPLYHNQGIPAQVYVHTMYV